MASQSIDELKIELEYEAGQANSSVKELKDTLTQLSASTTGITSKLNNISKSLGNFKTAMTGLDASGYSENIQKIAQALASLQNLGKSNLGSFVNQLKKIPDLNKSLDTNTIQEFTTKINQLSVALSPLANKLNTVSVAFSRLPVYINKTNSNLNKYNVVANKTSAINSKLNFAGIIYGIRRFTNMLSDFITASNSYVENLNLFTVSMGKNTDKALEWIGTIEKALGIDPSEMMRYMGVFNIMATGFGLSSDAAYKMSKNLTQLTYDMASYFDLNIEEAANKVKSAFAGELEPVRALGYSLDQATLKQIAYNYGVEESFTTMTQAEKAQLRYIALMTQIPPVQGDMGRTILSAANSIRVLKAQMNILGREIGNIFIPMLMKIIPVAISVVKVLIKVAKTIASLFGYELPDLNWDTITEGSSGLASDMDDAAGSAKEFKKQLQGFDELNLLTSPSAGGSGTEDMGASFELDLPEYDMLKYYKKGIEDMTSKIEKFFGITSDESGKVSWAFEDMDKKAKLLIGTIGLLIGVKALGGLATIINNASTVTKTFGGILGGLGNNKIVKSLKGIGESFLGMVSGGKNAKFAASALGKQLAAIGTKIGPIAAITAVVVALGATFKKAYTENEDFRESVHNLVDAFKSFAMEIGEKISPVLEVIKQLFNDLKPVFEGIINIIYEILKLGLETFIDGLTTHIQIITQLLNGDFKGAWETFKGFVEEVAINIAETILNIVKNVENIKENWSKAWEELGETIKTTFSKKWNEFVTWFSNTAVGGFLINLGGLLLFKEEYWSKLWEVVKTSIVDIWNDFIEWFSNTAIGNFLSYLGGLLLFKKEYWQDLWGKIKEGASNAWALFKEWFSNTAIGKLVEYILNLDIFKSETWSGLFDSIKVGASNAWTNFTSWWSNNGLSSWFNDKVKPWFTIDKWQQLASNAVNGIKNTFSNAQFKIKVPKFNWTTTPVQSGWMYDILSNLGLPTSIPKLNISWAEYASGGFPDTGEFFLAREAGPEMVGRIGNKTTVANNDQIVEGISAGVYEAVVSANSTNDNSVIINIGNETLNRVFTRSMRTESNRYGTPVVEV